MSWLETFFEILKVKVLAFVENAVPRRERGTCSGIYSMVLIYSMALQLGSEAAGRS